MRLKYFHAYEHIMPTETGLASATKDFMTGDGAGTEWIEDGRRGSVRIGFTRVDSFLGEFFRKPRASLIHHCNLGMLPESDAPTLCGEGSAEECGAHRDINCPQCRVIQDAWHAGFVQGNHAARDGSQEAP